MKGVKPHLEIGEGTGIVLSRCHRNKCPHGTGRGNILVYLKLWWERLGIPLQLTQVTQGACRCLREVKSPFELQRGARDYSGVTAGESGLIRMEGESQRVSKGSRAFGFTPVVTGT